MKTWEKYYEYLTVEEFKKTFCVLEGEFEKLEEEFKKEGKTVQNVLVAQGEYLGKLLKIGWGVLVEFGDGTAGFRTVTGNGVFVIPYSCVQDYMHT